MFKTTYVNRIGIGQKKQTVFAGNQLQKIREALAQVERQLAAKEAYLAAKSEVNTDQRNRILEECRSLMREALQEAIANPNGNSPILEGKQPKSLPEPVVPTASLKE